MFSLTLSMIFFFNVEHLNGMPQFFFPNLFFANNVMVKVLIGKSQAEKLEIICRARV